MPDEYGLMRRPPCWSKPEKECAKNGYDQGENGKNKDAAISFIHTNPFRIKVICETRIMRRGTKVKGKLGRNWIIQD
jgi:hypothetical protein